MSASSSGSRNFVSYQEVFRYVSALGDSKYADGTSDSRKRAIRKFASNKVVLEDGVLYYREDGETKGQWIADKQMQKQILASVHDNPAGGCHFGRDKTREKVCKRYYWHNMLEEIDNYVKTCEKCQKANPKFSKPVSVLKPIPIKDVWHRIGIDLIGPLPAAPSGQRYIITCTDYYSKWAEAGALHSKAAVEVARYLYSLFCRHGIPALIMLDQGREFVNTLNGELFKLTGVNHIISTAYHPQTNGLDERFNQTLQRALLKMVQENETEWDKYLDSVLFAYRTSKQASTKYSPFYILYGREPRLPVDLLTTPSAEVDTTDEPLAEGELEARTQMMVALRKKLDEDVKKNVAAAQERQKKHYDARHQQGDYKAGDLVLVKNMKKLSRKGSKMEQNWQGPYEIAEKVGDGNYYLRRKGKKTTGKTMYNSSRLKPFRERSTDVPEHRLSSTDPPVAQSAVDPLSNITIPASGESSALATNEPITIESNDPLPVVLEKQLWDSSLLRLWRTGADHHRFMSLEDDDMDDFSESLSEGEYALNYSVDVACWLDFRAFHQQPPLKHIGDFVIINSSLHDEFDSFRKEHINPSLSYIEQVELLQLYSKETVRKFGKEYLVLIPSEVDLLVEWVYQKQTQFDSEGRAMFRDTDTNCQSIDLTGDVSPPSPTKYWLEDLLLKDEDRTRLVSGEFLNDILIDAAQILLRKQFPSLGGLQSSNSIRKELASTIQSASIIQIHNTHSRHWVTSTTIGKPRSCHARVCDSMATDTVSSGLAIQIAKMYHTGKHSKLTVEVSPVQQQEGGVDCGLFAVAFATDLAFGTDPISAHYDQATMREHFLKCLEEQHMVPFPKASKPTKVVARTIFCVPLFCICHLPETNEMVCCDQCYEWFHYQCVGITSEGDLGQRWYCESCLRNCKRRKC